MHTLASNRLKKLTAGLYPIVEGLGAPPSAVELYFGIIKTNILCGSMLSLYNQAREHQIDTSTHSSFVR